MPIQECWRVRFCPGTVIVVKRDDIRDSEPVQLTLPLEADGQVLLSLHGVKREFTLVLSWDLTGGLESISGLNRKDTQRE